MDLGRHQLGTVVYVYLRCETAAGVPVVPDSSPQLKIYASGTLLKSVRMPIRDRYKQTGIFQTPVFLGKEFSVGHYTIDAHFAVSGSPDIESYTMEVIPGGDGDGRTTSMYFFDRPHADFVLRGLESGNIRVGRNPTQR